MHPDLDAIVSSDEEARTHVARAENRREQELTSERAACDAAIETRRRKADESLRGELQAIRAEGDTRVAEIRRQQGQYLATLSEAGERTIDDAVALYLRIVCEAPP